MWSLFVIIYYYHRKLGQPQAQDRRANPDPGEERANPNPKEGRANVTGSANPKPNPNPKKEGPDPARRANPHLHARVGNDAKRVQALCTMDDENCVLCDPTWAQDV